MTETKDTAFDQYRTIIEHEDGLIDKRIGWMLAFNGLLFAAYGLSLSAEVDLIGLVDQVAADERTAMLAKIATLRHSISLAGLLSCMAAMIGVSAAMRAIAYAKNDFATLFVGSDGKRVEGAMIAIAGSNRTFFWGMFYGLCMPALVTFPWCYILLVPDTSGVETERAFRVALPAAWPLMMLVLPVCATICRVFDNGPTPHLRFKTGKLPASGGID